MGIKVTPEQLQSLSGRVAAASSSIEGELGSLRATLAPLGTDWAGTASARFSALYQEWQSGAEKIKEALTGISSLLGQAGIAYADAEAHIASSFSAMG